MSRLQPVSCHLPLVALQNKQNQKNNQTNTNNKQANKDSCEIYQVSMAAEGSGKALHITHIDTFRSSAGSSECVFARSTLALHCSKSVADNGCVARVLGSVRFQHPTISILIINLNLISCFL